MSRGNRTDQALPSQEKARIARWHADFGDGDQPFRERDQFGKGHAASRTGTWGRLRRRSHKVDPCHWVVGFLACMASRLAHKRTIINGTIRRGVAPLAAAHEA